MKIKIKGDIVQAGPITGEFDVHFSLYRQPATDTKSIIEVATDVLQSCVILSRQLMTYIVTWGVFNHHSLFSPAAATGDNCL